jgi:hypothetical protein
MRSHVHRRRRKCMEKAEETHASSFEMLLPSVATTEGPLCTGERLALKLLDAFQRAAEHRAWVKSVSCPAPVLYWPILLTFGVFSRRAGRSTQWKRGKVGLKLDYFEVAQATGVSTGGAQHNLPHQPTKRLISSHLLDELKIRKGG